MDFALTIIARGWAIRPTCDALEVALSHVTQMMRRDSDWKDKRIAVHQFIDPPEVVDSIKGIIGDQESYGYRRVCALLKNEYGMVVNHKRVYRVMRDHNLLLYRQGYKLKGQRRHEGVIKVESSNQRWCSDGFEISCGKCEKVRIAFALDCCDREVMSWVATTRGITSSLIKDLMLKAVAYRVGFQPLAEVPIEWLTDNGSCYTVLETKQFGRSIGLNPVTTPVSSPQSNDWPKVLLRRLKEIMLLLVIVQMRIRSCNS